MIHRVMLGLIDSNQRDHRLKVLACLAIYLRFVLKIWRNQLQSGSVVGFRLNRLERVSVPVHI